MVAARVGALAPEATFGSAVLDIDFAKIGHDTLIDAVGIDDDLALRRLPEYFGEAHYWHRAG